MSLSHLDPRTRRCELEVQKIIHLQNIANQLSDTFIDPKRVTKSNILAANTTIQIDIPEGQPISAKESKPHLKCGRPISSKDKNLRTRKGVID